MRHFRDLVPIWDSGGLTMRRTRKDWRHSEYDRFRRRHPWWDHVVIAAIGAVMGVVLFLGVGSWIAFDYYDPAHVSSIQCTVKSAKAGQTSFHGTTISVNTSDCGWLLYMGPIDQDNPGRTAAKLKQGGRYEFEIGDASRKFASITRVVGQDPGVYAFRRV